MEHGKSLPKLHRVSIVSGLAIVAISLASLARGADDILIIDDGDEIVIEDNEAAVDTDSGNGVDIYEKEQLRTVGDDNEIELIVDDSEPPATPRPDTSGQVEDSLAAAGKPPLSVKLSELWLEYGNFSSKKADNEHLGYLRGELTVAWSSLPHWEAQLSARTYGYLESGDANVNEVFLDYGESYVRHISDNYRLTVGAQEVIWGRIDEFPPSDRLSTQDITRYVIDDLEDRRRPSAAIRYEYFFGNNKLDLLAIPYFRAAELPDTNSVWFPINQRKGEVFGLQSTPLTQELVKNARLDLNEPSSEGGFGLRYSTAQSSFDYAVTVQKGKQTLPYFTYDMTTGTIRSEYPNAWIAGGDVGFEALGGTLRFEAVWASDTPVTTIDGHYRTVESINWGMALELFPGDGDGRLNLQLMGAKLLTDRPVFDRDETYALSGSYEIPFANERWRVKTRYYAGLDDKDWYLNPELAYTGIPANELYLEMHYFDGSKGTPGGFHQDHSFLAVGWRLSL